MTTVSVVIPAFDAAAVLPAALASLAGQTRMPDEVIVVDDGSTDDTADVAGRWASLLPLQVVSLETNQGRGTGAGRARHVGISRSVGELIALLDADDVLFPDHLEVLLDTHGRHGGLVTANHLLWRPGEALGTRPVGELIPVPPPAEQWQAIISENFVFIGTLFARELYDRVGGFRSIPCEDWDLWIRMVEAGARVTMPSHPTALYRSSSSSVSAGDRLLAGDISVLTELEARLDGHDRAVVRRALRRRRARAHFVSGVAAFEQGRVVAARRHWIAAMATDPSLRPNNSAMNGLVAPRALACLVAPRSMVRRRDRQVSSAQRAVGGPWWRRGG